MANRDFPCYSPKQMYNFLYRNNKPIEWSLLLDSEKTILWHFADCDQCDELFVVTLNNLERYGLLTYEHKIEGCKIFKRFSEEIEKEKRDKLGVKVEIYKDFGASSDEPLIDLSTLVNIDSIKLLVLPQDDNYLKSQYLDVMQIVINDNLLLDLTELNDVRIEVLPHPDDAHRSLGLSQEQMIEIIRQYKELT